MHISYLIQFHIISLLLNHPANCIILNVVLHDSLHFFPLRPLLNVSLTCLCVILQGMRSGEWVEWGRGDIWGPLSYFGVLKGQFIVFFSVRRDVWTNHPEGPDNTRTHTHTHRDYFSTFQDLSLLTGLLSHTNCFSLQCTQQDQQVRTKMWTFIHSDRSFQLTLRLLWCSRTTCTLIEKDFWGRGQVFILQLD